MIKHQRVLRKFAVQIILLFNILAAALLLLAYTAPWIKPSVFLFPAFLGLLFPYLVMVNMLFVIFWIIRFRKEVLLSLIVLLLGWSHLMNLFPVSFAKQSDQNIENINQLSIMSYNVRMFDHYSWSKESDSKENIYKLINDNNPDILGIQEFYSAKSKGNTEKDIKEKLKSYKHYSIFYSRKTSVNTGYGIAVFSKYPILKTSRIPFDDTFNQAIYVDVKSGQDTIRVFNIHLQSISFKKNNYSFIDTLSLKYSEEQLKEMRDIGSRIGNAFIKRSEQSMIIHNYIKDSPYPVIVMGDFNDTPISYAYHNIKKGLVDAFRSSGKGLGNTYAGEFPSFRIDYILHDPGYVALEFKRLKSRYSDHFPIRANILLDPEALSE